MPGGHAEKLFLPENEAEIAEILREANEKRIPVTVSGARTGTVGGAVPFGGWVISLEKLNRIRSIDKDNLRAVVPQTLQSLAGDYLWPTATEIHIRPASPSSTDHLCTSLRAAGSFGAIRR